MHEYKHILDHPTRHLIVRSDGLPADDLAERTADFFAACVLMPRGWVKAAYSRQTQSVEELVIRR
jgi:Zn-dependent peptidase ImmA (M78 family)